MPRYKLQTLLIAALLLSMPVFGQDKANPGEALYGEWEIVEMVYRCTKQDFAGQAGAFVFEPGGFIYAPNSEMRDRFMRNKGHRKVLTARCVIRDGEIDIWTKLPWGREEKLTKALYELRDGK